MASRFTVQQVPQDEAPTSIVISNGRQPTPAKEDPHHQGLGELIFPTSIKKIINFLKFMIYEFFLSLSFEKEIE